MITSKIKARHWFLFVLLAVGLVLSLIGLALSIGEQYYVVAEEFRLVFYLSVFGTVVFAVLLMIGVTYLQRWRRLPKTVKNETKAVATRVTLRLAKLIDEFCSKQKVFVPQPILCARI